MQNPTMGEKEKLGLVMNKMKDIEEWEYMLPYYWMYMYG